MKQALGRQGREAGLRADHLAHLMDSLLQSGAFVSVFPSIPALRILDPMYFFPKPPWHQSYSLAPSRSMTSQAHP